MFAWVVLQEFGVSCCPIWAPASQTGWDHWPSNWEWVPNWWPFDITGPKTPPAECANSTIFWTQNLFFFFFHLFSFSSVQFSHSVVSDSLQPHELQHARPPCPAPTPGVDSNLCPLSQWCHQPSHPLSSPPPSAPNPSQHQGLFQWVSSSHQVAKVLEPQLQHQSFQCIQDWFPLGWTGWISLQSKGLSRVFLL